MLPLLSACAGDTVRVDGGSSLTSLPYPLLDHERMPPYGHLPSIARSKL
jgi:hypothetical protein